MLSFDVTLMGSIPTSFKLQTDDVWTVTEKFYWFTIQGLLLPDELKHNETDFLELFNSSINK